MGVPEAIRLDFVRESVWAFGNSLNSSSRHRAHAASSQPVTRTLGNGRNSWSKPSSISIDRAPAWHCRRERHPPRTDRMWATSSIASSRGAVASTSRRCDPSGPIVRRVPHATRVCVHARHPRRHRTTLASSDREDTLSALDRLVPGMSAEEAARTPPPLVDDDADAPDAPDVVLGDGRVVREVVVELEPPDNIAVAKIAVASASTRCVQMTVSPPDWHLIRREHDERGDLHRGDRARVERGHRRDG